jgi:hypothetical protein
MPAPEEAEEAFIEPDEELREEVELLPLYSGAVVALGEPTPWLVLLAVPVPLVEELSEEELPLELVPLELSIEPLELRIAVEDDMSALPPPEILANSRSIAVWSVTIFCANAFTWGFVARSTPSCAMAISRWLASVILRMNFWSALADLSVEACVLVVVERSRSLLLEELEPEPLEELEDCAKPLAATLRHAAAAP